MFHILKSHTLLVFIAPHTAFAIDAPIWMLVLFMKTMRGISILFAQKDTKKYQLHLIGMSN